MWARGIEGKDLSRVPERKAVIEARVLEGNARLSALPCHHSQAWQPHAFASQSTCLTDVRGGLMQALASAIAMDKRLGGVAALSTWFPQGLVSKP